MKNLLAKTANETIEEVIRHRTASFTPSQIAEWVNEQGYKVSCDDVMPIIGVLFMKGIVRRESKTEWAVI